MRRTISSQSSNMHSSKIKQRGIVLSLVLTLNFSCVFFSLQAQTSFCNPLNLNYRFQLVGSSRREAADPTVVLFKGKYYMFASKSGGYWSSPDLLKWNFITTSDLPLEDYAPTAVVIKDSLYFMALDKKIYKAEDADKGRWKVVNGSFPFEAGDPALFLDDDGRLYLYHGVSNSKPIYAVELNPKTFEPVGEQVECFNLDLEEHGWERNGDDNTSTRKSYMEGSWMSKHNGIYYLQYSAPGTQFKSYADGVYISKSPLGPFKFAAHNPFSYKPEGFIAGAGHSSTFQDKWGNYWHAGTMSISVKQQFERRVGLFPALFDKDGILYTWTAFGDFPHVIPDRKMNSHDEYQPAAMLLSYKKPVEVSSETKDHPKEHAVNEDIRTYWSAKTGNTGEWLLLDLQNTADVKFVQVNFAEEGTSIKGRPDSIYFHYLLEYSLDKKSWKVLADKTKSYLDQPHDYLELKKAVRARYIRIKNIHVPDGAFALSGLRVFGKGRGMQPSTVKSFSVTRDTLDETRAVLKWEKVKGVTGYNIRYGISPDKLYFNYQLFDADSLALNSLNRHQKYYFVIDTFNENGITKGITIRESEGKSK